MTSDTKTTRKARGSQVARLCDVAPTPSPLTLVTIGLMPVDSLELAKYLAEFRDWLELAIDANNFARAAKQSKDER